MFRLEHTLEASYSSQLFEQHQHQLEQHRAALVEVSCALEGVAAVEGDSKDDRPDLLIHPQSLYKHQEKVFP
jgi:hypothetical protein